MSSQSLPASVPAWDATSASWSIVLPAGENTQVFPGYPSKAAAFQDAYAYRLMNFVVVAEENVDEAYGQRAA